MPGEDKNFLPEQARVLNVSDASSGSIRRRRRGSRRPTEESRFSSLPDLALGSLIGGLLIAAPWLFGCTEQWSVNLMNGGATLVGVCAVLCKRRGTDHPAPEEKWAVRLFLALNLAVLAYCVIAILNARATFSIETQEFTYREGVLGWLPTTYDRARTGQFLVNSLALFSFFWGVRVWVLSSSGSRTEAGMSRRAEVAFWLLAINGFLVGLQGLLQRLSGSSYLLWFRKSYWETPDGCFGPFSYRGNAADYLNLIWPITFGFWYVLTHRRGRKVLGIGDGPELLLLPMFVITAAASFATLSRGGAVVAALMLTALFGSLLASQKSRAIKVGVAATGGTMLLLAFLVSGTPLLQRFQKAATDNLSGRTEIYDNAQQIARDFPWFGTGPNTFLSVYHLYREDPAQTWAAFLHDDWLETRVTFGRIGMAVVLLQLVVLGFWTYKLRASWISPTLTAALVVSLVGCLIHAKRDFPFQTYGIFFTFVGICALLTCAVTSPGHRIAEVRP